MHSDTSVDSGLAAPAPSRVSKFLAAGVAVVGATAIAVTPVSPVLEDVKVERHAVSLAASANPTYSSDTAAVYQNLFAQASANLTNLAGTLSADPLPILSQVFANQQANAEKVIGGITAIPDSFNSYWNGNNGKALFDQALVHLQAGEYADAWDRINRSFVYSLNVLSPVYAAIWSQAPSSRNPAGNMGIPEQMATNLLQVVQTVFDRASIVNGSTVALLGPFLGLNFEIALLADAVTNAIEEGDAEGVIKALVNAPGVFANTFLNGYVNPECVGAACEDSFPGLINASSPIINLFSDIPKAIAEALKPDPVPGAPYTPPAPQASTIQLAAIDSVIAERKAVTLEIEAPAAVDSETVVEETVVEPVVEETVVEETVVEETVVDETVADETVVEDAELILEEAAAGTTAPATKRPVSAAVKKTQEALEKARADVKKTVGNILKRKDNSAGSESNDSDSKSDADSKKADSSDDKSDKKSGGSDSDD